MGWTARTPFVILVRLLCARCDFSAAARPLFMPCRIPARGRLGRVSAKSRRSSLEWRSSRFPSGGGTARGRGALVCSLGSTRVSAAIACDPRWKQAKSRQPRVLWTENAALRSALNESSMKSRIYARRPSLDLSRGDALRNSRLCLDGAASAIRFSA